MTRSVRNLSPLTKAKIAASQKNYWNGKHMSDETKKKISDSMKKYWSSIPYANPETSEEKNPEEKN